MELLKHNSLSPDLLAEIKRLQFQTRRIAQQGIGGDYRSAFRGQGIEFEEVREYVPGMDIRSIDWKVTARSRAPFSKVFREERELSVMIAVDVSASTLTGTRGKLRERLIAEVGAVLTFIALRNNDKIGLVTYSNKLETYHPPRKARSSVWRILHEVMNREVDETGTDLGGLFEFLNNVLKKTSVIFILSDFLGSDFEKHLAVLSKRHDVNAIMTRDRADFSLPKSAALIEVRDSETGQTFLVDTANPHYRKEYEQIARDKIDDLKRLFRKYRVEHLELYTDTPFMPELRRFFIQKKSPARVRK